jgi:enoyl-CoA hydratase/carnithine racemase
MNYSKSQTENALNETYHYVGVALHDHCLTLTLNRPSKKNAMCPQMFNEIAFVLCYAHHCNDVWVVLIDSTGDVYCAGADLKAMQGDVEPHQSSIAAPNGEVLLGSIFEQVHKPKIAKVQGSVYAGGFFFLAGCHYVIAEPAITLGLPEVKRGLFPFQVMAALLQVLPQRKVLDWCMMGYNLSVEQALEWGLVTQIAPKTEIDNITNELIESLKQNAPSAIKLGLQAYQQLSNNSNDRQLMLKNMLNETIKTADAKEGFEAFKDKRKPVWTGT